jgi:hypothetical protein
MLVKSRESVGGTSLLGGRWNVGVGGMRAYLALLALSGIGFVVAGVVLLAGWVEGAVRAFIWAGSFSLLFSILWWPLSVWGIMVVVVAFVFAIVLGVMWVEPRVAVWFHR